MKGIRHLTNEESVLMEKQGCTAENWEWIQVAEGFCANVIRDTDFYGHVTIGSTEGSIEVTPGFMKPCGIRHAVLKDVTVGDRCLIENVKRYISNYYIGDDCFINNVNAIETTKEASFGEGTVISVLNEVGDGNVMIFDGLNSQLATLMVKYEQDLDFTRIIRRIIQQEINEKRCHATCGTIGNRVKIIDTGSVVNCHISCECRIEGAARLHECTLKSIPEASVTIGTGVILENSVIYDGSEILNNAKLENCFVGEACKITDGFTAENSLFFANCYLSNGEACAAFCGPFSASHHKSSLLIGGMYSFYNAGSGTNFSNHAYKMGPMHWGILERGTKTASGAYILMPAHIGTFSVCFGKLLHHPDTRKLPFSYLIAYGEDMYLIPGRNLTTVGLYRDIRKWPSRDKRPHGGKNSIVNFDWLSPFSVGRIMVAKRTLESLREVSGDVATYNFHDYVIKNSSLKKGIKYYDIALRIYMGAVMKRHRLEPPRSQKGTGKWSDLSGLLIPLSEEECIVRDIKEGRLTTVSAIRQRFISAHQNYAEYRWAWSYRLIREYYNIEGDITENDAERVQEDYITARRAWIAEIRKDAEREYQQGDITRDVLDDFLGRLDKEVEFERLKYDM